MNNPPNRPDPPDIAHGQRVAQEGRVVKDDDGERVSFLHPVEESLPPQQVTRPEPPENVAPHVEDVALPKAGPDIWEALPDSETPPDSRG